MKKKQRKEAARLWCAGILYHGCGMDSFELDEDCTYEDSAVIVEECQKIAERLAGKQPIPDTLPLAIGWAISKSSKQSKKP